MSDEPHSEVESPDVHFEPVVQLTAVDVVTMEEEEEELIQMRAKLFRFDHSDEPAQWKERGTGTAKLLRHKKSDLVRVLMRRDKTLKLCANHYVQPEMELKPNCGSEKAWVWTTTADFSDGEAKPELLAMRFANAENAQKWKEKFIEAQKIMREAIPGHNDKLSKESDTSINKEKDSNNDTTEETKASGDKSKDDDAEPAETEKADKEADSVAEKLTNLTVKENGDNSKDSEDKSLENKTENEEKS
ncbi:ran-specific GTPase-activating protein-like [Mercenaria mercenaria]|uniref:ran-specific GTPase-activating protein-like n=1 Tax=Mercenaria mercenaria TaxID=6596 RepID=UPI001E1D988F|nr:ran-specific GTPase-activating protein-like [Mercenaria mercenaria]